MKKKQTGAASLKNRQQRRKTMSSLVKTVLKRNRTQVSALIITYALTFSLMVLLGFFYPSIEKTFNQYLDEYRMPEANILTSVIPKDKAEKALQKEGVRAYSLRLVFEAQTAFPSGKTVSCRYCSVPENDEARYYDVSLKEDVKPDNQTVMISSYFAAKNDIKAGDTITVDTVLGSKELTVTNIVSLPETISTNRDAFAWYDSNDFAYLFVSGSLMDELFAAKGICNRIDLWFDEGADAGRVLAKVEDDLGSVVTYAGTYEGSDIQKQIKGSLDGTRAVVTYMPVLLIGMGILFSTLFFIQIVNRGEKQNGLMMAMGFAPRDVSLIYVRCALRLTLSSAVFGFVLGAFLLRFMLQIYVSTYDLPFVIYDGSLLLLPLLLIIIVLIGVVSSILSCLRLGKLDPAKTFQGDMSSEKKRDLPGWISRLKAGAFLKMSLCDVYRNRKRFWMSVLCGIACLILTFMAVSIISSKNESIRYCFEERFLYDVGIRCENEAAADIISALPEVENSEKTIEISLKYEDEAIVLEALAAESEMIGIMSVDGAQLGVPSEDSILIEEGFARRHHLSEGDQILIDGVKLTVGAITREYYDSIQYVSYKTAAKLGSTECNTLLISLQDGISVQDFVAKAGKTNGYMYYFSHESRRECVRSILSTLDIPCYVFVLFSFAIGAIIVSSMNLVNIAQRRKKYATLYVLGTSLSGFLGMQLPEAVLQFVMTVLLGCGPAVLCTRFMLQQMSVPSQEFVIVDPLKTLCISAAVVACYLMIGIIVTLSAIRNMKFLEVLSEK